MQILSKNDVFIYPNLWILLKNFEKFLEKSSNQMNKFRNQVFFKLLHDKFFQTTQQKEEKMHDGIKNKWEKFYFKNLWNNWHNFDFFLIKYNIQKFMWNDRLNIFGIVCRVQKTFLNKILWRSWKIHEKKIKKIYCEISKTNLIRVSENLEIRHNILPSFFTKFVVKNVAIQSV